MRRIFQTHMATVFTKSSRGARVWRIGMAFLCAGGLMLPHGGAQEPDADLVRKARKLRAEASYQEIKGKKDEALRLYEESLKLLPDEKVQAKVDAWKGALPAAPAEPAVLPETPAQKPVPPVDPAGPALEPAPPPAAPAVEPAAPPLVPAAAGEKPATPKGGQAVPGVKAGKTFEKEPPAPEPPEIILELPDW